MTVLHERLAWRGLATAARAAAASTDHSHALADAIRKAGSSRMPARGKPADRDARELRKTAERWCRGVPDTRARLAPDLVSLADAVEAHLDAEATACRRHRADIDE